MALSGTLYICHIPIKNRFADSASSHLDGAGEDNPSFSEGSETCFVVFTGLGSFSANNTLHHSKPNKRL